MAFLGQSMEKGTRAQINHINAQGGVHGRKIELLVASTLATVDLIEERKIPLVGPASGAPCGRSTWSANT